MKNPAKYPCSNGHKSFPKINTALKESMGCLLSGRMGRVEKSDKKN